MARCRFAALQRRFPQSICGTYMQVNERIAAARLGEPSQRRWPTGSRSERTPRSLSRSHSCSRSPSPPPETVPTSVQVAAASRSVLHAAACAPPIFNSAAHPRQASPTSPAETVQAQAALEGRCTKNAAPMSASSVAGNAMAEVYSASGQREQRAADVRWSDRCSGANATTKGASKVYASANMAPQLYVSLSGQSIAPDQLLRGSVQHRHRQSGSGLIAAARVAASGGPLAPMVPPDHLEPDRGAPGRPRRADMRPINYSPVNLERFSLALARESKRAMADSHGARNGALTQR